MRPWWTVSRPASRWDAVGRHVTFALLSGGILLASFVLRPEMIPFRTCVLVRWTGHPCITCGYTRAFLAMGKGDWSYVLHDCPVVVLLYALTVLVFSWNAVALALGVTVEPGPLLKNRTVRWGGIAVLAALILANWVYRWGMGLT